MGKEISSSIKTVYGMLWDVLALYEKQNASTKCQKEKSSRSIFGIT